MSCFGKIFEDVLYSVILLILIKIEYNLNKTESVCNDEITPNLFYLKDKMFYKNKV